MANASLFMDVIAKDSASAVFNKIGASAGTMSKGVDRAAKSHTAFGRATKYAFSMISAYSIGRFLSSSVKEYAAAELAQNKLEQAYNRFPKVARVNIQAFRDLNTALAQKTRFDDDAAAAMQANLARFDLTGKQILKLTPLVMDLAEATGTDLVTAGSNLGKSFLGNTRALKALGISYTATGDRAKDTANIIDLVNKKVGGEATRAGKTTAVQLEILKNQYGELKETVGQALLPAFSKLVKVAGPAITSLGAAIDRNMPQIEQTFEDVWNAGSKVVGVIKNMWDAFASMPPGVRDALLLLGGGTFALGKFKGSAIGTGVGSIFSGLKTITAGNVTVIGKTVTGTPGATGKTSGPGILTALGGPVGIAAIVTAVAVAYNGRQYVKDQRSPLPAPAPGGLPGLGNAASPIISSRNRASDAAARVTRQQIEATSRAAQDAASAAGRLVTQIRLLPKPAKEAAAEANKFAAAAVKAAQTRTAKITLKGAKEAAADAADVAAKIRRIQNKDAKITARSARKAAADAVNVAEKIRAIPDARPKITVDKAQAIAAIAQVTAALAAVRSKTIYLDTVRRETKTGASAPGSLAASLTGNLPKPTKPGEKATDAQKSAYERKMGAWQAQRDAQWQQTLAKRVADWNLTEEQAAWLGGMDRATARQFLPRGKNKKADLRRIRRLTRASNAMGNRSDMIAAQAEFDAFQLEQRFGNDPDPVGFAQGKLDAAKAMARSSSAKTRAKGLRDQVEWQQRLEQATRDRAEAERAAQESVRAAIEDTAASYRSFASIATTSTDDVAAAQDKLVTAQDAVAEAQRRFDLAGNDRDRAAAARELAEAQTSLTAAQTARNAVSDKVTAGSIRANMSGKLSRLRDFAAAVKALKGQGLNAVTLADILAMGPDQGYEYAKALLDGGLGDINDLQSQITRESASLGLFTAGVNSASATTIGQINAAAGGLRVDLVPAPVTLNLDGRQIADALLVYQRQSGG